ncbi:hypothetical protein OHA74_51580 [Streptomyces phaeochromogenes]|uniref:hypothetical protein n=1 Tax=Streptomyces phaeochromogenes TaxID=1923 RepID=UPI002E2C97F2|nr:hypothetical protein [Streptomyces phaeochromogenes]
MAQPLATDAASAGDLTALACLTRMFESEDYPESAERQSPLSPGAESRDLPGGTTGLNLRLGGSADGRAATELVERVRDIRGDEPVEVTGVAARLVDFRAMLGDRGTGRHIADLWVLAQILGSVPVYRPRICCPSGRPACWTWGTC